VLVPSSWAQAKDGGNVPVGLAAAQPKQHLGFATSRQSGCAAKPPRHRVSTPQRAGIGRKFQTPSIHEDLTVFENLEISFRRGRSVFGALAFRRDAEVRDRVEEFARTIFLSDLDQYAELLKHAQKQWLEIGMLLIQEPALMMLDELWPASFGRACESRSKVGRFILAAEEHGIC
jgi:ABC-type uncharacterized transport system ATPase subunit